MREVRFTPPGIESAARRGLSSPVMSQSAVPNEESTAVELLRLSALFALTALAEITGCYLPWLVLKQGKSALLLVPAAASLALFAWLLTLHPTAAGRTYAAYGGMYITVASIYGNHSPLRKAPRKL